MRGQPRRYRPIKATKVMTIGLVVMFVLSLPCVGGFLIALLWEQ